MIDRKWLLTLLALLMLTSFAPGTTWADDDAAADAPAEEKTEEPAEEADPFEVPKDASAAELLEFIEKVTSMRRPAKTREKFIENITKAQKAAMEAAGEVLDMKDITDEQAVKAVQAKLGALQLLSRVGDDDAADQMDKFIESLKDDKRPAIVKMMKLQTLAAAAGKLPNASPEQRQAFVEELKAYLTEKKSIGGEDLQLVMAAGRSLEHSKANDLAASIYNDVAKLAEASDNDQVKAYGKRFAGMARHVELPGNEMEVFGPLVGGEDFEWKDYRGKVVLVDFWATWCGPCIGELPNLKENYETYHSRGFDVVGVSLDSDQDKLEKFLTDREIPWPIIYDAETNGWENPLAVYYGISGIPAAILVGKDGKVVSLNARGEALGELLAELIGPANETEEKEKE